MIPIALLGSAVYMVRAHPPSFCQGGHRRFLSQGLQLARAKLSHEKQLVEAQERVAQLEAHLKHLESRIGNVPIEEVPPDAEPAKKSWWW
jgi:hypothetical protein